MANQTGIAITIKAFLPTGKTLDEVFEALSIVKTAHATGDYSAVLKAALVEEVKTEQKTRRIEDAVPAPAGETVLTGSDANEEQEDASGLKAEFDAVEPAGEIDPVADETDADVPEFVKKGRNKAA
jgi:hypothetical protein